MKTLQRAVVLQNRPIADGIFDMALYAPEIVKEAVCGQFINLYTGRGETLLPRPISICDTDLKRGVLRLVYQVVGKGTLLFSGLRENETVQVLGPLGNGFSPRPEEESILVGGGIGVPPLLLLAKQLPGKKTVFLGFRTAPILVQEFAQLSAEVHIATDDGSVGFMGNVVELMKKTGIQSGILYACGPKVMLYHTAKWARELGLSAQVSMEERMACGIGACVGCAVKIKKKEEADWQNRKVCKDGPVFDASEVVWDE